MTMTKTILIGDGNVLRREPEDAWREELDAVRAQPSVRLEFMNEEHHRVRDTVVVELPRHGAPLPPSLVAAKTGIAEARVVRILDELQSRLFFLVRNDAGEVSWAYPVTAETTAHQLRFATGEQIYAA